MPPKRKYIDLTNVKPSKGKVLKRCMGCGVQFFGPPGNFPPHPPEEAEPGRCPQCKQGDDYHFNEGDFMVGMPGVEG